MEKIMYQVGRTIGKSYASFKDGMTFHRRTFEIIDKYSIPCEESSTELQKAGITKEKYNKMHLGSDYSIEGIAFSVGALVDYLIPNKK